MVFSRRAAENAEESYAYNSIGNLLTSTVGSSTNAYAANGLNQYSAISNLCGSAPLRLLQYDADGNLVSDGAFHYAYDAENRLRTVTSARQTNGAVRVLNAYDHRHRRTKKTVQRLHAPPAAPPSPPPLGEWTTTETHTYVWDGNNIALETIAYANGTVRICEYFWGPDLSGIEQGAGGVGGLLAVLVSESPAPNLSTFQPSTFQLYFPCYDHNGNIVRYVSETGTTSASYAYDPFGSIISSSGPLADAFTFGFSTKPLDRETGLVSYQRRFYSPVLGRFLNRDPIEEEGGENLYVCCKNCLLAYIDILGLAGQYVQVPVEYQLWCVCKAKGAVKTFFKTIGAIAGIPTRTKVSNIPISIPSLKGHYSIPCAGGIIHFRIIPMIGYPPELSGRPFPNTSTPPGDSSLTGIPGSMVGPYSHMDNSDLYGHPQKHGDENYMLFSSPYLFYPDAKFNLNRTITVTSGNQTVMESISPGLFSDWSSSRKSPTVQGNVSIPVESGQDVHIVVDNGGVVEVDLTIEVTSR